MNFDRIVSFGRGAERLGVVVRWCAPSLAAAFVALALFAGLGRDEALAVNQARLNDAGAVAVLDLNRVLDNLDEQGDRAAELSAVQAEHQGRLDALSEELNNLREDIEVMPDGPEKRAMAEEFARLRVRTETEARFSQVLLDERTKASLSELFDKIQSAASEYAASEGISLVLSSDLRAEAPEGANRVQMDLFLSNRRVLYVEDAIDISEQVATMMNNQYRVDGMRP